VWLNDFGYIFYETRICYYLESAPELFLNEPLSFEVERE